MVIDALRAYVQIATGLTEVTREKATAVAKQLAAQPSEVLGGAASGAVSAVGQVQSFTEEIILTSRDNRALLIGIIRTEIERAVAALGFAKESEVDAVRHKVDRLGEAVGLAEDEGESQSLRSALTPIKKKAPAKKTAKKTAAKTAKAAKTPAEKTVKKTAQKTAKKTAQKAPAKKAPAKPVAAMQTPAPTPAEVPAGTALPDPLAAATFEAAVLESEAATADQPQVLPPPNVVDLARNDVTPQVPSGTSA